MADLNKKKQSAKEIKAIKKIVKQEENEKRIQSQTKKISDKTARKLKAQEEKSQLAQAKIEKKIQKTQAKMEAAGFKTKKANTAQNAKVSKKDIKANKKEKLSQVAEYNAEEKQEKKLSVKEHRASAKKAKKLTKEEIKDREVNAVVGDSLTIPEIKKTKSSKVNMESDVVLDVKNMTVSFMKKKKRISVIRGVDIKIKKGQIVGLVGESGSGKSVTTKALLDINDGGVTAADKAHLAGYDLTKLRNFNQIRGSKIGYIPQDPMTALNPTRQIWKQINDVLLVHRKDLKTQTQRTAFIVEILQKFGIRNAEQVIKQYPHSFSGGMRQRVVIAMVVAGQPDLIVADEPTTALDPTVQASVLELLEQIRNDFKISIIFISHNMSVVAKFVDFMYVMYAGKIVERGTTAEVFTDPRHPYTWALISALPQDGEKGKLFTIGGTPPNLEFLPTGDPFAPRNEFALQIDFKREPDLFQITETHFAATWLLHPGSPKIKPPVEVQRRIKSFKKVWNVK